MAKKVEWDYIKPVTQPADLKGVKPGKLPDELLKPAVGGGKLHHRAADAWAAMVAAAKADGIELKPVSAGDTYRTYDSQLAAFKQRYTTKPNGNATRTFEGQTWYKKDPKLASLAAPGTSQHNSGLAVDVHTAAEPKRLKWLIDNVAKFGFSWEVVPEEPWHLRYCDGDNVPAAVVEYLKSQGSAPATAPATKPVEVTAEDCPTLTVGKKGDAVKRMQQALKDKGYTVAVDGDFGKKTAEVVRKFQSDRKLAVDGTVSLDVWKLLLA